MRILLISHGFPPADLGGTEIYTRDLARAFVEHFQDEVHVLTRESDSGRREYELRRRSEDGIVVHSVNNTFRRCRSFAETYRNPSIRAIGARCLLLWRRAVVASLLRYWSAPKQKSARSRQPSRLI